MQELARKIDEDLKRLMLETFFDADPISFYRGLRYRELHQETDYDILLRWAQSFKDKSCPAHLSSGPFLHGPFNDAILACMRGAGHAAATRIRDGGHRGRARVCPMDAADAADFARMSSVREKVNALEVALREAVLAPVDPAHLVVFKKKRSLPHKMLCCAVRPFLGRRSSDSGKVQPAAGDVVTGPNLGVRLK